MTRGEIFSVSAFQHAGKNARGRSWSMKGTDPSHPLKQRNREFLSKRSTKKDVEAVTEAKNETESKRTFLNEINRKVAEGEIVNNKVLTL